MGANNEWNVQVGYDHSEKYEIIELASNLNWQK